MGALCTGCGDEPGKKNDTAAERVQKAKKAPAAVNRADVLNDFRAMLHADLTAGALEDCFAQTSSFLRCRSVQVPGVLRGRRPGQVKVEVTRDIYRVTGFSRTGTTFRIRLTSLNSFQHFDCEPATRGGACRSGHWFVPPELGETDDHVAHDLVAQQQARIAAFYIERCWTDEHNFENCKTKDQLEPYAPEIDPALRIGTDPGEVEITRTTRRGYAVAARSRSGTIFRAVVGPKRAKLSCTAKHSGGACRKGKWSDGEKSRRDDDVLPEAEWT